MDFDVLVVAAFENIKCVFSHGLERAAFQKYSNVL